MIWRVRDRATFARLARGHRLRQGPISLVVLPPPRGLPPGDPPRVAYAIGKKLGPAVTRNRVRRRLRSSVRRHAVVLRPGATYLFGASPAAAALPFPLLDEAVGQLLEKAERCR